LSATDARNCWRRRSMGDSEKALEQSYSEFPYCGTNPPLPHRWELPQEDDAPERFGTHAAQTGSLITQGGECVTPEEPSFTASENSISRRRMLKRIGSGAAIAWSAPVLTSVSASAQVTCPPSTCFDQTCQPACNSFRPCREPSNCGCFPFRGNLDACFCGDPADGMCESFPPCESSEDCGFEGEVCGACVDSCCPTGICMKPCSGGSGPARRRTRTGRRLTR
jgi:hypothetical protein